MTDKEIIKALECCFVQRNHSECPLKGFGSTVVDCRYELAHHVITLITARKSQIEDLKEALEERMEIINALIAGQGALQKHIDTMQTVAIEEFAWRLKLLLTPYPDCDFKEPVTLKQIDTLVKEMTEDTDNGAE